MKPAGRTKAAKRSKFHQMKNWDLVIDFNEKEFITENISDEINNQALQLNADNHFRNEVEQDKNSQIIWPEENIKNNA